MLDRNKSEFNNILRPRTAPFITPSIDEEQRQRIQSCVSVRVGVSSITWARLETHAQQNTPCLLTHWQHYEVNDKKLHLNDLVQRCLYVLHQIPNADCYLFENPQMAQANNPGNAEQQNINIQKAQKTAILCYALSARNKATTTLSESNANENAPTEPNLFYLRRFLTARLFNHLVGSERVSSEDAVVNLMRTYYNTDERDGASFNSGYVTSLFPGNVQFPTSLREMFSAVGRYQREFLGQALLLNLAFVRLVLLQDPNSIQIVSRSSSKNTDVPDM